MRLLLASLLLTFKETTTADPDVCRQNQEEGQIEMSDCRLGCNLSSVLHAGLCCLHRQFCCANLLCLSILLVVHAGIDVVVCMYTSIPYKVFGRCYLVHKPMVLCTMTQNDSSYCNEDARDSASKQTMGFLHFDMSPHQVV